MSDSDDTESLVIFSTLSPLGLGLFSLLVVLVVMASFSLALVFEDFLPPLILLFLSELLRDKINNPIMYKKVQDKVI